MRATALASTLFLLGLSGCGDAPGSSENSVGSGTTSPTETGDTGVADYEPATGITITKVVANQGVQVPLAVNGAFVGGAERNAPLVRDRDTLIRTFWTIDPDFTPRNLICRLSMVQPDGVELNWETTVFVEGNSEERRLETTCYFGLDAAMGYVQSGTTFQVSLWEEGAHMGLTDHGNVSPADGPNYIGLENTLAKIRVMMVPMTYNGGTPDVEGTRQEFEDYLYMNNPLNEIEVLVREPVPTSSSSLSTMLTLMNGLHGQDGADGNQYYFAVINTGNQSGTVGLAQLGSLWGSALWLNSFGQTRNTFVHEMGHCRGLGHVQCPGPGMAPYEPYPYEDGKTGVTGFGVRDYSIHGGDINYQYMSYCGGTNTTWASDWDFTRNWGRIKLFSSDQYPQGSLIKVPTLHGIVGADGVEHWWTVMEAPADPETLSANHMITFDDGAGRVVTTPMHVDILSDGVSQWFTVPIPEGMEVENAQLSRTFVDQEFAVELDMDKVWHRADAPRIADGGALKASQGQ